MITKETPELWTQGNGSKAIRKAFEKRDAFVAGEESERNLDLLVKELRSSLRESTVLTPISDEYTESIKRWSDFVEMRAVCYRQYRISQT